MEEDGVATPEAKKGWVQYNAPDGKVWSIEPSSARVFNNAFPKGSLWSHKGILASSWKDVMALKNAILPIKLGLSLFHFLHIATIRPAQVIARSMWGVVNEEMPVGEALKNIAKAITYTDQPGAISLGMAVKKAWDTPINEIKDDATREAVSLISRGGGSPHMSEEFLIRSRDGYKNAISKKII